MLRKHINFIEDVQRRFTKRIIGIGDMDYEQRLVKLKLPSLEYRRCRGDMIETYKITHNLYDTVTTSKLFTFNKSVTRGHPYKLTKFGTNTTLFREFFTNRVVNNWNSLPRAVVMSGSINSFKNALDRHWAEFMYCINFKS